MADNMNNTPDRNRKQPSMRELANERMRRLKEDPHAPKTGSTRNMPEGSTRPSAERTPSQRSERPSGQAERRKVSPESLRAERTSNPPSREQKPVYPETPSGERVRRRDADGANSEREAVRKHKEIDLSKRPAARDAIESERRRTGASSQKRPSNGSSQRRPSSNSSSRRPSREVNARSSKYTEPAPKKSSKIFWFGLAGYAVILLILSIAFLAYTDSCLKKYENSQSEHFVENYMKEFTDKAQNHGFITSDFTFETLDLSFVDTDGIINDYISSLDGYSSFTAEKDATNYSTESPVYNIMADGNVVARLTLKAVSQTKIFAILTIMDWDVATIEPVCSINLSNYTFMVPEGYTPVVDGIPVSESYQTGVKKTVSQFEYVSNYVPMPEYVEYKVENALPDCDIKILNKDGEEVNFERNGNHIEAAYASASSEMPEIRKAEALNMIQMYEDFNTADLSGANYGLATVQSFLIKDSDYWNMAKQWAGGVDITFTSAHVFDDPKYTNLVIDNYCEYSDVCYSVHIAFSKNMILTRTKEKISNDFDSTVFFINIDDTDDGTDNPHWCIADIIATTK